MVIKRMPAYSCVAPARRDAAASSSPATQADVLSRVFEALSPAQLARAELVCRRFRTISTLATCCVGPRCACRTLAVVPACPACSRAARRVALSLLGSPPCRGRRGQLVAARRFRSAYALDRTGGLSGVAGRGRALCPVQAAPQAADRSAASRVLDSRGAASQQHPSTRGKPRRGDVLRVLPPPVASCRSAPACGGQPSAGHVSHSSGGLPLLPRVGLRRLTLVPVCRSWCQTCCPLAAAP